MAGDGYFDSGTDEHVLVLMAALYVRASGCFEVGSQLLLAGKSKDGGEASNKGSRHGSLSGKS